MPVVFTTPFQQFNPCAATSYSAAVLADSPTGYWRLGDLDGTIVRDCSGNGHDAVEVSTGMSFQQSSLAANNGSNTAVNFAGTAGNYISLPDVAALKPTSVSIEFWVQPVNTQIGLGGVGDNNPPNCWGYWITYDLTDQRFRFFLGTDLGPNGNAYGQSYIGDQSVYPAGGIYHVVGTYTSGDRRLYVNGALEDSDTKAGNIHYVGGTINSVIGAEFGAGSLQRWMNGVLDEVAIYNYALTPTEVLAHYNAGI